MLLKINNRFNWKWCTPLCKIEDIYFKRNCTKKNKIDKVYFYERTIADIQQTKKIGNY